MCSNTFKKRTISEQFADTLAQAIREKQFGALLPSVRELGHRYGLNNVTVHKGLGLLIERGLLRSRGPRRRLAISSSFDGPAVPSAASGPCCRPLVFFGAELGEVNASLVTALREVERQCEQRGGRCVVIDLAGLDATLRKDRIRSALLEHKPTHLLLVYCDQATYDQVSRKSLKIATIGDGVTARNVPSLGPDLALLCIWAFDDLRLLGHRRFRFVGLTRSLSAAGHRRLKEFSDLTQTDARFVSGFSLDFMTMSNVLGGALKEGVTAFAFPRPEDFVLARSYFDSAGVRVPDDVSMVLMLGAPHEFLRARQPAHFKYRMDHLQSMIMSWFEFGEVAYERYTRQVIATYSRGQTVGRHV